jgi:hypothetical protein
MLLKTIHTLLVILFFGVFQITSFSTPIALDIQSYRTAVSPGTVDEDLQILRELIPELARRMFPVSSKTGRFTPDTLELKTSRSNDPGPGKGPSPGSRLVVNGRHYQQAAETYLKWRKEYETNWIQANASEWEPKAAPKTPLQSVIEDPGLDYRGRAMAMLRVYLESSSPDRVGSAPMFKPTPTPPPGFWPISDVIEIPEVNGSLQINLRGGKVTVLDGATGKASVIPYDSTMDPRLWLINFRKQALRLGLAQAVKMEQEKVPRLSKERNALSAPPIVVPAPESTIVKEESPPQIPWGK